MQAVDAGGTRNEGSAEAAGGGKGAGPGEAGPIFTAAAGRSEGASPVLTAAKEELRGAEPELGSLSFRGHMNGTRARSLFGSEDLVTSPPVAATSAQSRSTRDHTRAL